MRENAIDREALLSRKRLWLVNLGGFLYAVAMERYTTRDPLAGGAGAQGTIELTGIVAAFVCVVAATWHAKRSRPPSLPAISLALFALIAFASSGRSWSPALSAAKGGLILTVLATGYLLGQAGLGKRYLASIYWSYTCLLVVGLALAILLPSKFPMFDIDEFSGRTRLSLFSTHPGVTSECCSVLILAYQLIRKKPEWFSLAFLLGVNLFSGEKASSGFLVLFLLIGFIWRYQRRAVAITVAVMVITFYFAFFGNSQSGVGKTLSHAATGMYGTQMSREAGSLDGRADLWMGALGLLPDAVLLGYGVDGARDRLMRIASWSGQAHNSYLEASLEGGVLGGVLLLAAIAGIVVVCVRAGREFSSRALPLLGYLIIESFLGSLFSSPVNFGLLILILVLYLAPEQSPQTQAIAMGRNSWAGARRARAL